MQVRDPRERGQEAVERVQVGPRHTELERFHRGAVAKDFVPCGLQVLAGAHDRLDGFELLKDVEQGITRRVLAERCGYLDLFDIARNIGRG